MRTQNQKLKLLYLIEILLKETDEDHPMTAEKLIKKLELKGISAERKAIYRDIDALCDFGMDIVKGGKSGYFIGQRDFSIPELKLLADAVASSKFITANKSKQLLEKIENLASVNQAKGLRRQIYYLNRIKSENEQIYYNIDALHTAIEQKRQIEFLYYEYKAPLKKGRRKIYR